MMTAIREASRGGLSMGHHVALLLALAAAACSAAEPSPGSGGTGPGAGGSGGLGIGGSGAGGDCPSRCSSDLHGVVDCEGEVLSTCPPDQGCSDEGCVPACDSARANRSTVGCEWYVAIPPALIMGSCFATFVVNTWSTPVTLGLERAGQSVDVASAARIPSGSGKAITYAPLPGGELPPGEVAIVFLAHYEGFHAGNTPCPAGVTPAFTTGAPAVGVDGTGRGAAFRLTATAPVVAYSIYPYGGGQSAITSASLLLPVAVWDTNYVAIDAYGPPFGMPVDGHGASLMLLAAEDDTSVTIQPAAALQGSFDVAAAVQNVPTKYTLSKGEVLQFVQPEEPIGSPIQSNKPIGLVGGSSCMQVPLDYEACDAAHQQIPPVRALGSEYVAVRHRNRFDDKDEATIWRIVGAVAGTTLTYDPPGPPPGAPTEIWPGKVAELRVPGPFVVRSQDEEHPFYMAAYMGGCREIDPTATDCRGDPEFVNVIATQQYLTSYVFFTDPTYPETSLVIVRQRGKNGFAPVTLDCVGEVSGFQPIGGAGQYEYARVDLVRHDFEKQGSCDNGRHEMASKLPFTATVWGWGSAATGGKFLDPGAPGFFTQAVSYAYPVGAGVRGLNTIVVPAVPK